MEALLGAIIIFLFAFLVYRDVSHRRDMSKKDDLIKDTTLKFMSKDVVEYSTATKPEPENTPEEPDPLVPIEDVPFDKIEKAVDEL